MVLQASMREMYPYFIASEAEVKDKFCIFQALMERQTGCQIKTLRTDCGQSECTQFGAKSSLP